MIIAGIMSGTSLDGITIAAIDRNGKRWSLLEYTTLPYPKKLRERILAVSNAEAHTGEIAKLNFDLGEQYAKAALKLKYKPQLIGCHGQTIFHGPGCTLQLGEAQVIAERTQTPVVNNFRPRDIAAGGQGAPLLPIYHAARARASDLPAAFLNVGGVANITWIGTEPGALLGFDTGPGNGLIDDWVQARLGLSMDRDGAVAARGRVHEDLVQELLQHDYFTRKPPKSLDRYAFTAYRLSVLDDADGAATLTAFTAAAVAAALTHCPARPQRIYVAGGGRHNPILMKLLEQYCAVAIASIDDLGWDGDAVEAQGFAYLAVRSLRGLPLTFPGTTGIKAPLTGGRIASPGAITRAKSA